MTGTSTVLLSDLNSFSLYLEKDHTGAPTWTKTTLANFKDLNHLAQLMTQHPYGGGVFKASKARELGPYGWRALENFVRTCLIIIDVDNDPNKVNKPMSLKAATKKLLKSGHKFIILPSRNHQRIKHAGTDNEQPAVDRYRIVLIAAYGIYSAPEYKATFKHYCQKFKIPYDNLAAHAATYFYPSPSIEPGIVQEEGSYITPQEPKPERYASRPTNGAPTDGVGQLSAKSRYFLTMGSMDKSLEWHKERNFFVADCRSQNFTFDDTRSLLLTVTGHLTEEDEYQLKDIFYKRLNFKLSFNPQEK